MPAKKLTHRYHQVSLWSKIGFWGSIASIVSLAIYFFPTTQSVQNSITAPTKSTIQQQSSGTLIHNEQHNEGSTGLNVIGPVTIQSTPLPTLKWTQTKTETLWKDDAPFAVLITITTDQPTSDLHFRIECDELIARHQFNIGTFGSMSNDFPSSDGRVIEFAVMSPVLNPSVPLTVYIGSKKPISVKSVQKL